MLVATGRRSRVVVKERRGLRHLNAHLSVMSVVDRMDGSEYKVKNTIKFISKGLRIIQLSKKALCRPIYRV